MMRSRMRADLILPAFMDGITKSCMLLGRAYPRVLTWQPCTQYCSLSQILIISFLKGGLGLGSNVSRASHKNARF